MTKTDYPGEFSRIKAATIDSIFIILLMYLASEIFNDFDNVSATVRTGTYVFIFFLYEPLFVSIWGSSIGHNMVGIKVVKKDFPTRNLSFLKAIVRLLIKYTLGWISLLTISSDSQRRAIHDKAVSSIVIYVKSHN